MFSNIRGNIHGLLKVQSYSWFSYNSDCEPIIGKLPDNISWAHLLQGSGP